MIEALKFPRKGKDLFAAIKICSWMNVFMHEKSTLHRKWKENYAEFKIIWIRTELKSLGSPPKTKKVRQRFEAKSTKKTKEIMISSQYQRQRAKKQSESFAFDC